MKKAIKLTYLLFQTLFYIFTLISGVAVIFWIFGQVKFPTVGYLILSTFGFLFLHIVFYRLYTVFYIKAPVPEIPSHLEK